MTQATYGDLVEAVGYDATNRDLVEIEREARRAADDEQAAEHEIEAMQAELIANLELLPMADAPKDLTTHIAITLGRGGRYEVAVVCGECVKVIRETYELDDALLSAYFARKYEYRVYAADEVRSDREGYYEVRHCESCEELLLASDEYRRGRCNDCHERDERDEREARLERYHSTSCGTARRWIADAAN